MVSDRIQRRIERLLDQIEQEADQQSWQRVRDLAKEVLRFAPDNGDAKTFLAVAEETLSSDAGQIALETAPPRPEPLTPALASTSAQPTSFANGRYPVKRFLGEGGMKRVYLAQDTTLDREVAFALIKAEGLDDVSRTRIQREAHAMGRLGSPAASATGAPARTAAGHSQSMVPSVV